ncbi:MAG: hypothetical protein AAFR09_04550, partial [Pseudomonadota bacterium]
STLDAGGWSDSIQSIGRIDGELAYALVTLTERADRAAKGQSGEDAWPLLLRLVAGLSTGSGAALAA